MLVVANECVIHQFEKDIEHIGERYVTKLPFRPDHDFLPDNNAICKDKFKKFEGTFGKKWVVKRL